MVDDASSPDDLTKIGEEYQRKHKNFHFERNSENKGMV